MLRLLIGLIKGAVIGGGVGYGAYEAGIGGGMLWLTYGLIGALVGFLVGRPAWSHLRDKSSTVWTSVIKAVFGAGVSIGIYALVAKAWGGFEVSMLGEERLVQNWQFLFGGAIGGLYGAFIELDDSPAKHRERQARQAADKSAS